MLPGRKSAFRAGFWQDKLPGKNRNGPSGRPKAGQRAEFGAFPVAVGQNPSRNQRSLPSLDSEIDPAPIRGVDQDVAPTRGDPSADPAPRRGVCLDTAPAKGGSIFALGLRFVRLVRYVMLYRGQVLAYQGPETGIVTQGL